MRNFLPRNFVSKLKIKGNISIYYYSVVTGLIAGLVAMLFTWLLGVLNTYFLSLHYQTLTYSLTFPEKVSFIGSNYKFSALILFLPAIGGLLAGILNHFSKEASGTGADEMIGAFHHNEGNISTRAPFIKGLATIFTLSTGGSGGKEGPIALIGAGIGVIVSRVANAGARARRTLLLAGSAAGLGAAFKAPLGGALTAVEMVYKEDIESDALIPCFISSVVAYLLFTAYSGTGSLLNIKDVSVFHLQELPFYIVLGVLCFVFGYFLIKGFRDTKVFISRIKIHPVIKPAIGGLMVGFLSLTFFEIAGTGDEFFEHIYNGSLPNYFSSERSYVLIICSLLLIAFLKIVATTLTIGSGGSAGIFGPSLFIGGMLGAATGILAKALLPETDVHIASFIVVGMGAFYAGVVNAPLAGIIMICEITGTYILLPPLILVSIFSFVLSNKISFYKNQVSNRFKSPAHHWDMRFDVIDSIVIQDMKHKLRNLAQIKETDTIEKLMELSVKIHASDFVVYNDKNEYSGMVSLRKLDLTEESSINKSTLINEVVNRQVPFTDYKQRLSLALKVIMQYDFDKVAVVERGRYIGYIRTRDILNSYSEHVNLN